MNFVELFRTLGLSQKESLIYFEALQKGPSSVRILSQSSGIQRATTYDVLKSLMERGLISYYHKAKKQFFVAEDPERLLSIIDQQKNELTNVSEKISGVLPELKSLYDRAGEKPVVRYYEGDAGIKTILLDVLNTTEVFIEKEYLAYSSAELRPLLYRSFCNFTDERIKRKISVRVIALGEGGGEQLLSERKWIKSTNSAPTYQLIYANKLAIITSKDQTTAVGVVIEDKSITQTQKILFEALWKTL